MEHIIAQLTGFIISFISTSGYTGIFILMTLESALIPIPSEITLSFAGFLATTGRFNFWLVVFVGTMANMVGSIIIYYLGHWGESLLTHEFIRKYGKYLLISEHELVRSEVWFRDHGDKITFFSRILPVIRTVISLPAGIAHMEIRKFIVLTFLGSLIWCWAMTYIGFALGQNWQSVHVYYQRFEYLIVGSLVLGTIYFLWHKVKQVRK